MKERKRTVTIRLRLKTYARLRHIKHLLEKETFDETVSALLNRLEDPNEQGKIKESQIQPAVRAEPEGSWE